MSTTRRSFLSSLTIAAAAPAVLANALAAPPLARSWGHWTGNTAWIMYDLLSQQRGSAHLDRSSFARLAAYCDEPVDTL